MNENTAFSPAGRGRYHIATYGCQMNAHESEKIAGILESLGYQCISEPAQADVIVLNTCCIRESAEQRILGHIGTLKKYKERNPDLRIAVVGCLPQQPGAQERLGRSFPFLDVILGTQDLHRLGPALAESRRLRIREHLESSQLNEEVDKRDALPMARTAGPSAQVNIMYGCSNYCAYCIVPHVRGPERSRSPHSILAELEVLAGQGVREVQLLGQNVNSYENGVDFAGLLRLILEQTSFDRIRFMTSHPKDLSVALIELMASEKRLCSHIHLPLQSGSDSILRAMNRRYTFEQYLGLVGRIRDSVPDVALTTDLIVGFPGETAEDFARTLDAVDAVRFAAAYTFVYSPRRGTKAAEMTPQISKEVKKERITQLIDRQNEITRELNGALVGQVQEVLVTGPAARGDGAVTGRTDGGRTVNFPGPETLTGQIVPVRITQAKSTTLFGRLEESGWRS